MRKISLIPYKIADGPFREVAGKDGVKTLVQDPDVMFDIKMAMVNMLFTPANRLSVRDLIEHDRIAKKIEAAGDEVLLEETEYRKLKDSIQTFTGYVREDLEFVNRILDAQEVEVKEA